MLTAEMLYQRTKTLDATTLQEVANFLDFLLNKKNSEYLQAQKQRYFAPTTLEDVSYQPLPNRRVLSLDDMAAVIEFEASQPNGRA